MSLLIATWLLFAIAMTVALSVWGSTSEKGVEKELATATTFAIFAGPMYLFALIEFVYGLITIRSHSKNWKIINLVNPIVVGALPIAIGLIVGVGP